MQYFLWNCQTLGEPGPDHRDALPVGGRRCDIRQAAALARESLAGYMGAGDRHGMTAPLERLSDVAYRCRDPAAVRRLLTERDRLRVQLGFPGRDPWTV